MDLQGPGRAKTRKIGCSADQVYSQGRQCADNRRPSCSGRPRRRSAGGRLDRPRQAVAVAVAPATAVGRVLAGADAVAGTAARSVLVEAAGGGAEGGAL